jgi:hypothetical protein
MARVPKHLKEVFEEDEEGECPSLKPAMVRAAEQRLGYRLPAAYVELLKVCNGGTIRRSFFPTDQCKSWADDHVAFETVMGICPDEGIDGEVGSASLIAEWDDPDVGVVISSDGHTAFMLDYSGCGPEGAAGGVGRYRDGAKEAAGGRVGAGLRDLPGAAARAAGGR